ncbi:MMPL family transporter [Streptacidiphilus sp. P02-A3a]|uniref:MMPL family transporter n=1 Tax=Streptacidiphilus sp. P02-A3a TaxID=2704468 RepID=UPI0015F87E61|nr:MMPL family transporter [Streptacidiphilus sp. P02-A3a]QMU68627.1 MMPL family transporter [Streptacidiphilus sp. P02-A3a]
MFHRIGRTVVRHPIWTIVTWIVAAVVIFLTAPALASNSNESSFLPTSYESIQAMNLQQDAFPAAFTPAAEVLFQRADGQPFTAADKALISQVTTELGQKKIDQVQAVIPGMYSKDGKYDLALVKMNSADTGQPSQNTAAQTLRADVKQLVQGTDLEAKLGGNAASALDQQNSSKTGGEIIFLGTFLVIIVAMLIIFRAPLMALLPLLLIAIVMLAANGLINDITKLLSLQSNSTVSSLLIIVLFGVGTDYILFLMFRYRERLRAGDDHKEAMITAVGRVGEAIASAAGAVIIAFLALTLSSVSFLKQMGPALAISVAVTLIAGLTLMPAVFSLIPPRWLFAPSKRWSVEPTGSKFTAVGRVVQRRPAAVAAVAGLLMIALATVATGYKASFDFASASMPKTEESMVVQNTLASAFSAGSGAPAGVFLSTVNGSPVDHGAVATLEQKLQTVPGVAAVTPAVYDKKADTADISVTLSANPESEQAMNTVKQLRDVAHANAPDGTKALVGGETAVYVDINKAINHDYSVVFPVAGILIMLILALMLRSVVAPWYLMASVGLGFAATIGATVLIFQHLQNQAGLMFLLPVFVYLFVVAIGTDYNILMISRLREEARAGRSPREAAGQAIRHAGPTVASAGAILAGTFASMMLAGNSLFSELGFSISFGIVMAAFVMAMFFTPALTALIGHAAWWPGHADRNQGDSGHGESRVVAGHFPEDGKISELDPTRN